MTTDATTSETTAPGTQALNGFWYQVNVSVWAALDLLLAKKAANEVILEPTSQEDLEADLDDTEQGPMAARANYESYRLIIQAKLRSTDTWNVQGLKSLLTHGSERLPAASRLKDDPSTKYVLVTSAALSGKARKLGVQVFGAWPPPADLPSSLRSAVPDAAGRLAVLAGEDLEFKIPRRLRELLEDSFKVPHSRYEDCVRALQHEALRRMRGDFNGIWARTDLELTIKAHDGMIASSAEAESFVKPTNWAQFKQQLEERHAIIIVGHSGTGKTTAAEVLMSELREAIPGLSVIRVTQGPAQVRNAPNGPVVFMIEDPWGRYRFEPSSEPWNDELPEFLKTSKPNRLFIITSRSDVLGEAHTRKLLNRWFAELESEHYGLRQRHQLFDNRVRALPPQLQRLAVQSRDHVLGELATPLEIQKFFDGLIDTREPEINDPEFIRQCLEAAHRDSIEATVVSQVRNRDAWGSAAVVWGLLKACSKVSRASTLPAIETRLAQRDRDFEDGLEPFINFLVAGRNLRQVDSIVSYYHPRVEAGLETAIGEKKQLTRRVLGYLVDELLALDHSTEWGYEPAARLIQAVRRQKAFTIQVTPASQIALDTWFRKRLTTESPHFEEDLQLAADVGSESSATAEFSRWLFERDLQRHLFDDEWAAPVRDEAWYQRMQSDPDIARIAGIFVRQVMPIGPHDYSSDWPPLLRRLAPDITKDFLVAATRLARSGFHGSVNMIAKEAAADLDAFAAVASQAIQILNEPRSTSELATAIAAADGEFNGDYADYMLNEDEGYAAGVMLETYVQEMRRVRGWTALRDHQQVTDLLNDWIRVAGQTSVSDDELAALCSLAWGSPYEDNFWHVAEQRWRPFLEDRLLTRVLEGHQSPLIRASAVGCFARHMSQRASGLAADLLSRGDIRRLLELTLDCKWGQFDNDEAAKSLLSNILKVFPKSVHAAVNFVSASDEVLVDEEAIDLLSTVDPGSNDRLRLRIAQGLAGARKDVASYLDVLNQSDSRDIAKQSADIAVSQGLWQRVRNALQHRYAEVRCVALSALAKRTTGPLPPELLALGKDPSGYVRRDLVNLLNQNPEPSYLKTLIDLAHDDWAEHTASYFEFADYPIARIATQTLCDLSSLPDEYTETLWNLQSNTQDPKVRENILATLAEKGSESAFQRVFNLALADRGKISRCAQAAWAVVGAVDRLKEQDADRINPHFLKLAHPSRVVPMVFVLGMRGSNAHILECAAALASYPDRRAILLAVLIAAREQSTELARSVGKFLPVDIFEAFLTACEGGSPLPPSSIENLGSVEVVDQVIKVLNQSGSLFSQPEQARAG
ncbi:hypothetical protein Rvan_1430 [Rhodomicrobium vannielii ATCC 17100]|uniref:Novel STAND NTPase 3 domain-containing protein n=1 Tax=Rhodomicrobium vannielii (strain ATCC 17100 / DSM 162 / LMG 4299 / NCIMB 10020 / ATH 3.1.1) TaxID=648757 RepID=E3I6P0_RHOVT|nr:hypothetical protein [Rhodomicrobium vannielii]ADP70687.1 hypothetical protein Rvan_1430 [Rhodomicrobium vannielii ATCC 17100]